MLLFLHVILPLLCLLTSARAYKPWKFNGSTPGLNNLILGRCHQFQEFDLAYQSPEFYVNFTCTTFWEKFKDVFAYKDSCALNFTNAYKDVLDYIGNKEFITDKALFWSGTKLVAHDFTHVNTDYYTLEDTFPGYFADNLKWCGCKDCNKTEGINYDYCNSSCDATSKFWDDISRNLAKRAKGTAYVLLNGTSSGTDTAYYRGSVFGRIELPAIGASQNVKNLVILLINNLDEEPKEKCGTGSLKQLEEDARKYKVPNVKCIEEPTMVNDVLCAKYPHANECLQDKNKKEDEGSWKDAAIALIAVSAVLLLCVLFLLVIFFRKRRVDDFQYRSHAENA